MHSHALSRHVSSEVERHLDKVDVAGPIPARVTNVMTTRFYGYKHWTLEEVPRCFYVGKGLVRRPYDGRRNSKWHVIVSRYGLRVEVCVGFMCPNHAHAPNEKCAANSDVCAWEIDSIIKEDTFTTSYSTEDGTNIRCNFTHGGDGATGHMMSEGGKRRVGDAQRGRPKSPETKQKISNVLQGRKLSNETRLRMSEAKLGKPLSTQNRRNLWANRSHIFTDAHLENMRTSAKQRPKPSKETIQKRSASLKGKRHKCSICSKIGHTRPTCPDRKGA